MHEMRLRPSFVLASSHERRWQRENTKGTEYPSARLYVRGFREHSARALARGRAALVTSLCQYEHTCPDCGERFWGGPRAGCCSHACRCRRYRAAQTRGRAVELAEICEEILRRRSEGSAADSKLLPRLFRAAAAELRRRGWDPLELILSRPDEPASDDDTAPGGIEGAAPTRRRWLHTPEEEVALLEQLITDREAAGLSTTWFRARRRKLQTILARRTASAQRLTED